MITLAYLWDFYQHSIVSKAQFKGNLTITSIQVQLFAKPVIIAISIYLMFYLNSFNKYLSSTI